jgi:hypothetical protein
MVSQISKSDMDTKDKKLEGRKAEGKTPWQESLVSVGNTRTIPIAVPVIEVPTNQRHNTQLRIKLYSLHSITNKGTLEWMYTTKWQEL